MTGECIVITISFEVRYGVPSCLNILSLSNTDLELWVFSAVRSGFNPEIPSSAWSFQTFSPSFQLSPQILEIPAHNWMLLLEVFIEARQFNPATAAIKGFLTDDGKSKLRRSLREMVESANCPIITAWDPERRKVRDQTANSLRLVC